MCVMQLAILKSVYMVCRGLSVLVCQDTGLDDVEHAEYYKQPAEGITPQRVHLTPELVAYHEREFRPVSTGACAHLLVASTRNGSTVESVLACLAQAGHVARHGLNEQPCRPV